jgi:hypothetical protein
MNNQDINELFEDALSANAASDAFKERVLRDSTAALIRGRVLRRQLRVTGLTLAILLVTAAAFICGRLSVSNQITDRRVAVQTVGEKNDGVRVSRDLVVWLDAARFFTQLGMNERAALSYRKASELIPRDMPDSLQAGFRPQSVLASLLHDYESVCGHSQEFPERINSERAIDDRWGKFELPQNVLSNIIAQNFGG